LPERVVLHIDFDYFYAQCEETRSPQLKTKVVSVCIYSDRGNDSGAIATCNYIARKYGVKSGMPIKLAKQKLKDIPNTVFLPADFDFYANVSSNAMEIIKKFGDVFEYVGKDEAYLDVTEKTNSDFKKATHLSQQIKNEIREKTKLTCSIGVSPNKLIAKIASNYKKPDGLTIVTPEKSSRFLESLKIRDIPGIGKQTEKKFLEMHLETIVQVKELDIFTLNSKFGKKIASFIFNAVRGIDDNPVAQRSPTIQYSKISTLSKDSKEFGFLLENLKESCKRLISNHITTVTEN